MKVTAERWTIAIECRDYIAGVGWWKAGKKVAWRWLSFDRVYYDGRWWTIRIGPFYLSRGPY